MTPSLFKDVMSVDCFQTQKLTPCAWKAFDMYGRGRKLQSTNAHVNDFQLSFEKNVPFFYSVFSTDSLC